MKTLTTLLTLLVGTMSSASLLAQTPLHAQVGDEARNEFGAAATDLGDVDGDGVSDYAFGTSNSAASRTPGYVRVFSGATGQTITTLTGNSFLDEFGRAIAGVGDVSGDGVPDLLVGAERDDTYGGDAGMARVYSGSDWSVLREHPGTLLFYGSDTACLGDVNGDGVAEYLISCGFPNEVYCFDGATGTLLWQVTANNQNYDDLGRLSPVAADATGDGIPDALLGAVGNGNQGLAGYAMVVDGTDGSEVYQVTDGSNWGTYATALSWIGDLNGDQRSEFALCNPTFFGSTAHVDVHDGASGALLSTFNDFGNAISGVGDQDGDGIPDFVTEALDGTHLYSGATFSRILSYDTYSIPTAGTSALAPIRDLDGDGLLELLHGGAGNLGANNIGAGIVHLSSAYLFQDVGFALGGSSGDPLLMGESTLQAGSVAGMRLSNASVSTNVFLFVGMSAVHLPLMGGTLVPSPDFVRSNLRTDSSGTLGISWSVPPGVASQTEYYSQFWILDVTGPQGVTASNALKTVFP